MREAKQIWDPWKTKSRRKDTANNTTSRWKGREFFIPEGEGTTGEDERVGGDSWKTQVGGVFGVIKRACVQMLSINRPTEKATLILNAWLPWQRSLFQKLIAKNSGIHYGEQKSLKWNCDQNRSNISSSPAVPTRHRTTRQYRLIKPNSLLKHQKPHSSRQAPSTVAGISGALTDDCGSEGTSVR